jgi:hypothetical protein
VGAQKARPPPKTVLAEKSFERSIDYSSSQIHSDSEKWLYSDPEYPEVFPS